MQDLKTRLTSRKLMITLGSIAALILMGVTEQMEWASIADKITLLVLAYVGVEGVADIRRS